MMRILGIDPGSRLTGYGLIDCDGTSVRANVINTPADPEHVHTGMKLKLATQVVGTDSAGTEAIGFGFEPLDAESTNRKGATDGK